MRKLIKHSSVYKDVEKIVFPFFLKPSSSKIYEDSTVNKLFLTDCGGTQCNSSGSTMILECLRISLLDISAVPQLLHQPWNEVVDSERNSGLLVYFFFLQWISSASVDGESALSLIGGVQRTLIIYSPRRRGRPTVAVNPAAGVCSSTQLPPNSPFVCCILFMSPLLISSSGKAICFIQSNFGFYCSVIVAQWGAVGAQINVEDSDSRDFHPPIRPVTQPQSGESRHQLMVFLCYVLYTEIELSNKYNKHNANTVTGNDDENRAAVHCIHCRCHIPDTEVFLQCKHLSVIFSSAAQFTLFLSSFSSFLKYRALFLS